MKHYLVFFVTVIAITVSYKISPYFVQHRYVQPVKNMDLPTLVNKKHFSDSNILLSAIFRKKSVEVANKNTEKSKIKKVSNIVHTKKPAALNMIYYENGKKVCKIDGNVLREGQYYNGIRVLKIEKSRVLIKTKKYRKWLVLNVYANKKS